ncbi:unnamed protein product [Trifolium pratense]|uniref:Uncharacterized protein n=1 Tax=Trifolium pratense TaxID=57577 RepID=A0ACB0MDG1_TRIPR|nr:unnamed protein product [Trifolium pratense]
MQTQSYIDIVTMQTQSKGSHEYNDLYKNEFHAGGSQVRFQPGHGKLLAVANKNVINIISVKTFNLLKILQGHVKDIYSICWDSRGQWIASASEDEVCIWSLMMDGECLYQYSATGKKFKCIIFHPRYRNVLVIGSLQCMELLIFEVGQVLNKRISDLPTTGLADCMQNGLIASTTTSNDSVLFICNVETNRSLTTSESHSLSIFEVRFQPGSTIFATSSYANTVKLWNAERHERSVFEFVGHNERGMELLVIDVGGLLIKHVPGLPTTGLAACMQNEFIASTTSGIDSMVNIWK